MCSYHSVLVISPVLRIRIRSVNEMDPDPTLKNVSGYNHLKNVDAGGFGFGYFIFSIFC